MATENLDGMIIEQSGGVPGGHFDLDTSTSTYEFNKGKTVYHVHQYDDHFNTTGVDFFNLRDDKFVKPNVQVTSDRTFRIIVGNSQLSSGATIIVNGKAYTAAVWAQQKQSSLFSFSGLAGTEKLSSFQVSFDAKKSIVDQLIGTTTELVRSNAPGPNNSYRAGALTLQLIDSKSAEIDAATGLATIGSSSMLWEATLFYHVAQP